MINLKDITKIYTQNKDNKIVLKNFEISIDKGSSIIITGDNGVGKTTLLKIISLLDKNYTGSYKIDNNDVNFLSNKKISNLRNEFFGVLFQESNLIENESVYYNIEIPLIYSKKFLRKNRKIRIEEICDFFDIRSLLYNKVKTLSGGEKQKVALARAIINDPECIILDEPTNSLSKLSQKNLLDCIEKIIELDKTLILVTHDLSILDFFYNNYKFLVYELKNGKIVEI